MTDSLLHCAVGQTAAPNDALQEQASDGAHTYLYTGETRRLTRDKVTPEYAAILAVCSRYLWVSPYLLHTEVAQLEYEMGEVEAIASVDSA